MSSYKQSNVVKTWLDITWFNCKSLFMLFRVIQVTSDKLPAGLAIVSHLNTCLLLISKTGKDERSSSFPTETWISFTATCQFLTLFDASLLSLIGEPNLLNIYGVIRKKKRKKNANLYIINVKYDSIKWDKSKNILGCWAVRNIICGISEPCQNPRLFFIKFHTKKICMKPLIFSILKYRLSFKNGFTRKVKSEIKQKQRQTLMV